MADARDAASVYWVEPTQRAILPLDGFHLSRSLRKTIARRPLPRHRRRGVRRRHRAVRRKRRRPARHLDQRPRSSAPSPSSTSAASRIRSSAGTATSWSAGSTASRSARRSSANRWSAARPTRRRSRSPGWSRGCGSAASPCSTASSRPPHLASLGAVEIAARRLCRVAGRARSSGSRRRLAVGAASAAGDFCALDRLPPPLVRRRGHRIRARCRGRTSRSSWPRRRRSGAGRR